MFSNFAWSEMLLIAVVAIIVVGPKDLPAMLRTFGKTLGTMKRMAGDFQRQFSDAIKEADLEDVKELTSTKGFSPLDDAKKTMEDLTRKMNEPVADDPVVDEPEPVVAAAEPQPAEKPEAKPKAGRKPGTRKAATVKKPATARTAAAKTRAKTAAAKSGTARKPASKSAAQKKTAATGRTTKAKTAEAKSVS